MPSLGFTWVVRPAVRHAGALCSAGSLVLALAACGGDSSAPPPPPPPLVEGWSLLAESPSVADRGHFMDAWFLDASEGWVVGVYGEVYHTGDGGLTWERRHTAPDAASFFRSVTFVSPTLGWVGDFNDFSRPQPQRALWETRDGGFTFTNVTGKVVGPEPVGICGLWSVDASTIYGVGRWNGPAVFVRSTDGGESWQSVSLAPMMTGAVDVYFFDRLRGIVVGGRGVGNSVEEQNASRTVVLMTEDGGTTWTERYVGSATGHWAWKISFPTPQVGYVATQGPSPDRTVLKTTDGGRTWTEQVVTRTEDGFAGIGFVTERVGWVGGENVAFETSDGGVTWQRAPWGDGESFNRFRVLAGGGAFAIGRRIFKFTPVD